MENKYIDKKYTYIDVKMPKEEHWVRIRQDETDEKLRSRSNNFNCLVSIQRYAKVNHTDEEDQFAPLYFDLDKSDKTGTTFEDVKADLKSLINFFNTQFGLSELEIRTWFSGNKGAHLLVNPYALGITPHPELTYILKHAALYLEELLGLKTLDSKSIYSIRRQWRLTGSIHPKSNLFKTELTWEEWDKSEEEIRTLCKEPRKPLYTDSQELEVSHNLKAHEWFKTFINKYMDYTHLRRLRPKRVSIKSKDLPACVRDALSWKNLPANVTGDKCLLNLVTYFKDAGYSKEQTFAKLEPWATGLQNVKGSGNKASAHAAIKSTIRTVFHSADKYCFTCSFMRALGTADNPISCEWGNCKCVSSDDQEPKDTPHVSLFEATNACYTQKKLEIPVVVAGKGQEPYTIPITVRAQCWDIKACKKSCAIKSEGNGNLEVTFSIKDPETLKLIRCPNASQAKVVRQLMKIHPTCTKCDVKYEKLVNVEEVQLIPQIMNTRHSRGENEKDDESEYALRKGFFFDYGLKTNRRYNIFAYPMPDPWLQTTVFTFSDYEANTLDFRNFKMSPDIHKALTLFNPAPGQSVSDKFLEIHKDLEVNVHRIKQRYLVGFGVDLTYHSVLDFKFNEELVGRGWVEMMILGDSGQGKSKQSKGLQEHYGMGAWIACESATRTGLVYGIQKNGTGYFFTWGEVPLNHGGLVFMDEFSGLNSEEFAQMSELRTSGVAKIQRIVTAETLAKVRKIMLSNPRQGYKLNQFSYGCEALGGRNGLIPQSEDIRRFDFALAVCSGDVDESIINAKWVDEQPNKYTSALCNMLIRWVWSRKPEDIVFMPEAEDSILHFASLMGTQYSSSIPLVEAADQRIKIARLAVAAAARMFSSDETGEKIIVKAEHVLFVYKYLQTIYASEGLGYWAYSEKDRHTRGLTKESFANIEKELETLDKWDDLASILIKQNEFSVKWIEENLAVEYDTAKLILATLRKHDLIKDSGRWGYMKTATFTKILRDKKKKSAGIETLSFF